MALDPHHHGTMDGAVAEAGCHPGPHHVCCADCRVRFLAICSALDVDELRELNQFTRLSCFEVRASPKVLCAWCDC
jgi:hypothetical protein